MGQTFFEKLYIGQTFFEKWYLRQTFFEKLYIGDKRFLKSYIGDKRFLKSYIRDKRFWKLSKVQTCFESRNFFCNSGAFKTVRKEFKIFYFCSKNKLKIFSFLNFWSNSSNKKTDDERIR